MRTRRAVVFKNTYSMSVAAKHCGTVELTSLTLLVFGSFADTIVIRANLPGIKQNKFQGWAGCVSQK